tara:strand:+ start:58 stop:1299 length:1242 start_codon:yes stop_codon:yes gene_type:complete
MSNTIEEFKKALKRGDELVVLPSKITGTIRVPYGVRWKTEGITTLTPQAKLYLDGPQDGKSHHKIFEALAGQIQGHFGGDEVQVGWWSGYDPEKVDDITPHIEAAAKARRPSSSTLKEWNKNLDVKYITGDITGGSVRLPAGLWSVRSTINLGSRYVSLKGAGETTALHFLGLGATAGILIKGAAKNSSISHMAMIVDPSCDPEFVTIRLQSGFLEGTHFHHLFMRGTRKAAFETIGMSSNHFRVSDCHIIDPQNEDSIGFLARALSDRFSWHNNTVAQIQKRGKWKRHIDISGYDKISIRDSHFECAQDSAISINDERGGGKKRPSVLIESCFHNFGNGYWRKTERPQGVGALVHITAPFASVTVIQSQTTNGDTVLIDETHDHLIEQSGAGNNIIIRYERTDKESQQITSR